MDGGRTPLGGRRALRHALLEDGGYYLIALRAPRPGLFAGGAWSTPSVRAQTLARAAAASLSVRELAPLRDVDTLEDLRTLGMPDPV